MSEHSANSIIISKRQDLQSFLKEHIRVSKENDLEKPITNTRIGRKNADGKVVGGGCYHIPDKEYGEFMRLHYIQTIEKNQPEYLTETQKLKNSPIPIDLDFRYEYGVITEKQYKKEHVEEFIDEYLEELKLVYQFEDGKTFPVYIFEKSCVHQKDDEKITKDGIHIIIGLQSDSEIKLLLRKKMIEKIATMDLWRDFPTTNDWESVFDIGVSRGTTNWQVYGSRKPNYEPYRLTMVYNIGYDSTDGEITREEIPLREFSIEENIYKLSVRYTDHPQFAFRPEFLKTRENLLSVSNQPATPYKMKIANQNNANTARLADNTYILNIHNANDLENAKQMFLDTEPNIEVLEAYDYVMTLPETYYNNGSYDKWIRIGWALRNVSDRLLIAWVAMSAKMLSFDYRTAIRDLYDRWQEFTLENKDGLTIRSIKKWSKEDAKEAYGLVVSKYLQYYVEKTIDNNPSSLNDKKPSATHVDIAEVLHKLCGDDFICVGGLGSASKSRWLYFDGIRWKNDEAGTSLRTIITTDLRKLYVMKSFELYQKLAAIEDPESKEAKQLDERAKKFTEVGCKLGDTNQIRYIMEEASHKFYDRTGQFYKNLDTYPYTLCCKNGIIDFKERTFRNGRPEDNISKCTGINYVKLDKDKHAKTIAEINDFMYKLFPEEELRNYMWDHLASGLFGMNKDQLFTMYIGEGKNGKSVLVDFMKLILGEYYTIAPISLITDKRGKIGGTSPEIVLLKGARFVTMAESSKGESINEGVMKQLTGGTDEIQARALFIPEPISFIPQFNLILGTNNFMKINSQDYGTWRRIHAVNFKSTFTDEEPEYDPNNPYRFKRDDSIKEKMELWKEVFLSMLVEVGYKTQGSVKTCKIVSEYSDKYKQEQDSISMFIHEKIIEDANAKLTKSEVSNEFKKWCEDTLGSRNYKPRDLHNAIDKKYGVYTKNNCWNGIRIIYDMPQQQYYGSSNNSIHSALTDEEEDELRNVNLNDL